MTQQNRTTTGHDGSAAPWLDLHYRSSRPEYEDCLRAAGLQPGWRVLDAGSGAGNFLPLMADLVGPQGEIAALDLAPENTARVEALGRDGHLPAGVRPRTGSVLDLPFADASFDAVWSANVVQYLTPAEFGRAVAEFRRVLKPGGTLAIKEFDATILQIVPFDAAAFARFMAARLAGFAARGILGTGCGTTIASRLRAAGVPDLRRRGWLVERWAPVPDATRAYVRDLLAYFAGLAPQYGLPEADLALWRDVAATPERLLDDADFCYREFFVLTVAQVAG